MRIELSEPYKSILTLTTVDLPDLAVLIGRNGAGKTQILDAILEGAAVLSPLGDGEIEKYDFLTFQAPNSTQVGHGVEQFAQAAADAYLTRESGRQPRIEVAAEVYNQFASAAVAAGESIADFDGLLKDEVRQLPDFALLGFPDGSDFARTFHDRVLDDLDRRSGRRQLPNSFNDNPAVLLCTAMKLTGKLPHELDRDDIIRASHYEGNTISNSLSEAFAAYKVEQFIWAHTQIEREPTGFDVLMEQYQAKHRPPWDILREILAEMRYASSDDGLFDFEFSDPSDYAMNMGSYENFVFYAELTNRSNGAQYEIDSLSSGEKVLMALCLVSFNQYLGRRRPKVLLLDELDAVLHPSMIAALVKALKMLFVQEGTKVLLTSHSPITVAALEDGDIYRVARKGGDVTVSSTTKSEAIAELSEGLATVDVGLKILAQSAAPVTILTEGNNVRHLLRWVNVMGLSDDVRVLEGFEGSTSKGELVSYGRLLGRMETNTHFLIVWDWDAAGESEKLRRELAVATSVTPFAFAHRPENTIARRGIENNYDPKLLEPFAITKSESDGTILGYDFPADRKAKFADHIWENGTVEDFRNFKGLHAIVREILDR